VLKTAEHILAAADRNHDERLRATLLAVDVLLAAKEPDRPRARLLLADVAPAAETLDPASPAALEYQYRRLQLAQQSGEANMLAAAAQAIAEHGRGSPYELPALVIVARAADEAVHAAGAVERPARVEEAAGVYSRLVELLGDSPAVLASSKNALAAASKLAQYDEELGNWPQAADRLTRLVQSLPSDRRFLRRAGVANFQAGRFAASLELWRKLLAGLPAGSDEWLEAKNYQLACLLKTDRPTAVKVWEQFKLLYPEVKSATWRDRFEMLEREFH
jgi:tetratricopeptide (TPR) repeat protein